jgi:hypothetical protein
MVLGSVFRSHMLVDSATLTKAMETGKAPAF